MKKGGRRWHGRCSICPTFKDRKKTGNVASAQKGCARATVSPVQITCNNLTGDKFL
jgi:hypothetical protein